MSKWEVFSHHSCRSEGAREFLPLHCVRLKKRIDSKVPHMGTLCADNNYPTLRPGAKRRRGDGQNGPGQKLKGGIPPGQNDPGQKRNGRNYAKGRMTSAGKETDEIARRAKGPRSKKKRTLGEK